MRSLLSLSRETALPEEEFGKYAFSPPHQHIALNQPAIKPSLNEPRRHNTTMPSTSPYSMSTFGIHRRIHHQLDYQTCIPFYHFQAVDRLP